jgi:predicted DNA binding protein
MSILVDLHLSTERFELGRVLRPYEGIEAELERIVPTGDRAIPYVWVSSDPETLADLTEAFEANDRTGDITVLDELTIDSSDRQMWLYRIEWSLVDPDVVKGIVDAGGTILEGESTDGYWQLRLRFREHGDVAEFYRYLTDHEITDFSVDSIHELTNQRDRRSDPLTPEQREALTLAAQRGYFTSPREASLREIGDELGITQQATSGRIRRGVRNVVFDTLNLPVEA